VAAVGIALLIHRHVEAPLHRKCDAMLARILARG
jgi:peptidoglycan/LPS O-acetylase OafA/YrhL